MRSKARSCSGCREARIAWVRWIELAVAFCGLGGSRAVAAARRLFARRVFRPAAAPLVVSYQRTLPATRTPNGRVG